MKSYAKSHRPKWTMAFSMLAAGIETCYNNYNGSYLLFLTNGAVALGQYIYFFEFMIPSISRPP